MAPGGLMRLKVEGWIKGDNRGDTRLWWTDKLKAKRNEGEW